MTDRRTLERIRAEQMASGASRNGRGRSSHVQAVTVRLSDVAPEQVRWLWPGRIPRGKLTVLEGDPGLGKSTLALDLAARLSTGRTTLDGHPMDQGATIIMTAEDGLADTIHPRLDAAGADSSQIVAITGVTVDGQSDSLLLPVHLAALRATIEEHCARLGIVDPFSAFLGSEINSWRDHDVRRALRPLAELAEATGAAIVVIRHLTKGSGPAIYRGGGSIGIGAAARSVLLVAQDPDDEGRRVLAVTKTNLAAEAPSLSFRVESDGTGRSRISWLGLSQHRSDELVAAAEEREAKSALDEAVDLLMELLARGPRPVKDVDQAARDAGVARATLRRARQRLRIRSSPEGFRGPRVLSLPPSSPAHENPSDASVAQDSRMSATGKTEAPET